MILNIVFFSFQFFDLQIHERAFDQTLVPSAIARLVVPHSVEIALRLSPIAEDDGLHAIMVDFRPVIGVAGCSGVSTKRITIAIADNKLPCENSSNTHSSLSIRRRLAVDQHVVAGVNSLQLVLGDAQAAEQPIVGILPVGELGADFLPEQLQRLKQEVLGTGGEVFLRVRCGHLYVVHIIEFNVFQGSLVVLPEMGIVLEPLDDFGDGDVGRRLIRGFLEVAELKEGMVGFRFAAEALVVQTERAGDEVFAVIETGDNTHLFFLRHLAGENDLMPDLVVVRVTIEVCETCVGDTHCFLLSPCL